jgi:hypothetical protein
VTRPEDQLRRAMQLNAGLGVVERVTAADLEDAVVQGLWAFGADAEADVRLTLAAEPRLPAQGG